MREPHAIPAGPVRTREPGGARRATGGSPVADTTRDKADFVPTDPEGPTIANHYRSRYTYDEGEYENLPLTCKCVLAP